MTGKRLGEMGVKFESIISSTMTRAIETADIIADQLPSGIPRDREPLLNEGAPFPPEPPIDGWTPDQRVP